MRCGAVQYGAGHGAKVRCGAGQVQRCGTVQCGAGAKDAAGAVRSGCR